MICLTCQTESSRIIVDKHGHESCHSCAGFSEVGSTTTGSLTRSSFRVRIQQTKAAGDFVQPFAYDKTKRKQTVNPDFIKLYPDQAKEYYSKDELKEVGAPKLFEHGQALKVKAEESKAKQAVEFVGDGKKTADRILNKEGK